MASCFPKQMYPIIMRHAKNKPFTINITIVFMCRKSLQLDKLLCRLFSTNKQASHFCVFPYWMYCVRNTMHTVETLQRLLVRHIDMIDCCFAKNCFAGLFRLGLTIHTSSSLFQYWVNSIVNLNRQGRFI